MFSNTLPSGRDTESPIDPAVLLDDGGMAVLPAPRRALQATAHEGNQGALKLASLEEGRNTPRSKFYALRLHWFRSWLHCPLGDINISLISTEFQKADMLTKSLGPTLFRASRKLAVGW